MDENKETDSKDSGEYEDDFEKDLEWLINGKDKSSASIIEVYKLPTEFIVIILTKRLVVLEAFHIYYFI